MTKGGGAGATAGAARADVVPVCIVALWRSLGVKRRRARTRAKSVSSSLPQRPRRCALVAPPSAPHARAGAPASAAAARLSRPSRSTPVARRRVSARCARLPASSRNGGSFSLMPPFKAVRAGRVAAALASDLFVAAPSRTAPPCMSRSPARKRKSSVEVCHPPHAPPTPAKRPRRPAMRLLDLSDDALALIVTHVMSPAREGSRAIVTEESLRASLPLALTCRALHSVWRRCMTDLELWVSGRLTDRGLVSICAASGRAVHRLGLRRCRLSVNAFRAIPRFCPRLRSLDLSHTRVTDDVILSLAARCGSTLQFLALHGCTALSSRALRAIADSCTHLRFLDIGAVPAVDDDALSYLVRARGASLRTLVLSHCTKLSDTAMDEIGTHCSALMSLTVRSLSSITDRGLQKLCEHIGHRLQILDVLDCTGLTMGGYFSTMEAHCPHVFRYLQESNYVEHLGERCLRDNIIATMPGLIYRISATDAIRRLPALYFLLLDESTLRPFRVSVQSKSLNLSDFGTVLISNFGKKPTQKTRSVLLSRFGYDSPCDSESDDESCARE